jgi:NADPH:quinone reductase-like Zn-dependent oxidoreductase
MRAVICRSGGANAYADAPFEYAAEWPRPQLGDLHDTFHHLPCPAAATCLVRVGFSSMNPADRGTDDHRTPKVMGSDIAGTIIAVGPGCSRLKVGDEVWGDIGANASFSTAAAGGAVTTKQLGAWAEVCVALETQLSLKPSNITQLEAGVLPKVALTSWKALAWYADARAWSSRTVGAPTVLILGGSSGCGTCAIQIARAFGAKAVHTTCSARNVEYCRGLGADTVVDYTNEAWVDAFGPDSLDVVYDCIGEASSGDGAMATLRSGGCFVSIRGVSAEAENARDDVSQSSFINSDTNLDSWEVLDELTAMVESEALRMRRIEQVFELAQIDAALAQSATSRTVGKVAIRCAGELSAASL